MTQRARNDDAERGRRAERGRLAGFVSVVGAAVLATAGLVGPGWAASVPAGDAASPEQRLYGLVAERLGLMREVAASKWQRSVAIEDPPRERLVVASAAEAALARGLRPETAERFFRAQIEAAKDIQRHWFERWRAGAPVPRSGPGLDADLRPRLLQLGEAILDAAAVPQLAHSERAFQEIVAIEGLGAERRLELFDALTGLRGYPSRLDQIFETGVLRVGTTGDYPPFSLRVPTGAYRGIDIDLARDLAAALGVQLALVETSWPTLVQDLSAGRYDVAMSGISRTLQRARVGYFSAPYHLGGKTAIARCEEADRYGSLAAIDQAGVRVIVNPGGTNEAFVDGALTRATKVLHADNRTIFEALAGGAADVMITDRIEVALQEARVPELCSTTTENFTKQSKSLLMPKDDALLNFVATWLDLRTADGSVERVFDKHLRAPW